MTNRTNWAELRALKHAVGSLPPAENIDRAQVASLGSAGPAAGASVDLDQLAAEIVRHFDEFDTPYFPSEVQQLTAFVTGRVRQIVAEQIRQIDHLKAQAENREPHIAGYIQSYNKAVTTMHAQVDEIRQIVAERDELRTSLTACQSLALTLGIEVDQLKAAVRAWHAGAPSWNAEDDLYREMLQLAGIESGTPAGPPVAAAVSLLDQRMAELRPLRRLTVESFNLLASLRTILYYRYKEGTPEYQKVERIHAKATARDQRRRAAVSALEARPLRPAPTPVEPPVAPAGAGLDVERLVEEIEQVVCENADVDHGPHWVSISFNEALRSAIRALVLATLALDPTTTTRPQAAASEEAQDAR